MTRLLGPGSSSLVIPLRRTQVLGLGPELFGKIVTHTVCVTEFRPEPQKLLFSCYRRQRLQFPDLLIILGNRPVRGKSSAGGGVEDTGRIQVVNNHEMANPEDVFKNVSMNDSH